MLEVTGFSLIAYALLMSHNRWNNGPYSGAFKRIMTVSIYSVYNQNRVDIELWQYTYIVTIPLIAAYSIGYAYIKYRVGWVFVPEYGSAFRNLP